MVAHKELSGSTFHCTKNCCPGKFPNTLCAQKKIQKQNHLIRRFGSDGEALKGRATPSGTSLGTGLPSARVPAVTTAAPQAPSLFHPAVIPPASQLPVLRNRLETRSQLRKAAAISWKEAPSLESGGSMLGPPGCVPEGTCGHRHLLLWGWPNPPP